MNYDIFLVCACVHACILPHKHICVCVCVYICMYERERERERERWFVGEFVLTNASVNT